MQSVSVAHGEIGAGVPLAVSRQAHAAAGSDRAEGADRDLNKGAMVDLGEHDIVGAAPLRRAAHVADEDAVAIVYRQARKGGAVPFGVAHGGHIIDRQRGLPDLATVEGVAEVHVAVVGAIRRRHEGVDHTRITAAVDLQVQGRKGRPAAVGGQQVVAQSAGHTHRRAEGSPAVGGVGVVDLKGGCRTAGEHGSRGSGGLLDPGHVDHGDAGGGLGYSRGRDVVTRTERGHLDDGDVDLQAVRVGGTRLFAALHGVEMTDHGKVRRRRLVQVDADRHVVARDEVLHDGAVGGVEADGCVVLEDGVRRVGGQH